MKQTARIARPQALAAIAVLTVLLAGLVFACAGSGLEAAAPGAQPELLLRYADNQADSYPTTQAAHYFAEQVKQKSGGRIQIKVYGDAVLGDEQSVVRQVRFGGIDFARVSLPPLAELTPEIDVLQMPFLYNDAAHMWRVLDGDIGDGFLSALEAYDLIGLSWYDAGARSFYATRPIQSLHDLRGMRVRVQENTLIENMVRALGAQPVPMVFSDVLSALQTGKVDAAENNLPSYESMKHYRAAPYFYKDEHFRIPEAQIMSALTWRSLSPEDQAMIQECALDSAKYERMLWNDRELAAERAVLAAGSSIETASAEDLEAFREAMAVLYEDLPADDMQSIERIRALGGPEQTVSTLDATVQP